MARQQKPKDNGEEDEILRGLRASSNSGGRFDYSRIDAALLGMVIAAVTAKGAQIAFSTTKEGDKGLVTCWYKGFPSKNYYETPEAMMAGFAFTLDLFLPKTEAWDEWRTYGEEFK